MTREHSDGGGLNPSQQGIVSFGGLVESYSSYSRLINILSSCHLFEQARIREAAEGLQDGNKMKK
ncbi:hypothetical protein OUZ56_008642 [Daphnia magna]|uniref:Uncharacterized protein n=1 Tax=Daphnia magna TaxID=35525 RepID=A0ABR0ADL6_9CRUS|nr:hypothetical protein OUZ56_008642 [Daphnia magna]